MILKNVLPFENYTLTTKLSIDEVIRRLADNVEERVDTSILTLSRNFSKPYTGRITGTEFIIKRNINYRNSFLPEITGRISKGPEHTHVNITMRPATFILIFISIWLGIVGLICISMLFVGLLKFKQIMKSGISPMNLIPFGLFVFGSLMTHFAFKAESKNSKVFFSSLLESVD